MLAQTRPTTTTATTAIAATTRRITVDMITVCNLTASAVTFRIFQIRKGAAYDENSALFWDVELAANSTILIDSIRYRLISTGDAIGVRTATASALTFTIDGEYV